MISDMPEPKPHSKPFVDSASHKSSSQAGLQSAMIRHGGPESDDDKKADGK